MMKKTICLLFGIIAMIDSINGAPLGGMLFCAALSAAVLFGTIEYLAYRGSAAAEMMGRMSFIISIVGLLVMPWPTMQKIFAATLLMAASSFAVYFIERYL
jgi:hypothetical protein